MPSVHSQYGGAIEAAFSDVKITLSSFVENFAEEAGAIDAWYSQLDITNDTAFIGNKADDVSICTVIVNSLSFFHMLTALFPCSTQIAGAMYFHQTTATLSATKFSSSALKDPAGVVSVRS